MSIYAMSDLHLSLASSKPMDIFGEKWQNHEEKIAANWEKIVREDDWVILAGDHSWGLKEAEVIPDLTFINRLPGKKILLKGNHDIWFGTDKKNRELVEKYGFSQMSLLQYGAVKLENTIICATRGWISPQDSNFKEEDMRVYKKEVARLESAMKQARKLRLAGEEIVVFMHYPPFSVNKETDFTRIIEENNIKRCFYGHIHGEEKQRGCNYYSPVTKYIMISADFIDFQPVLVVQ